MTAARVRRVEVPAALRADERFAGCSYASAFELPTAQARSRTPELWARATFEDAPAAVRALLVTGWKLGLGLRMGPRASPGHVLGWPVAESGQDSVTLEARSWLVATYNIVLTDDSAVRWATFVRFRRPLARAVWALAAPVHHLTVPFLLARANRSAAGG